MTLETPRKPVRRVNHMRVATKTPDSGGQGRKPRCCGVFRASTTRRREPQAVEVAAPLFTHSQRTLQSVPIILCATCFSVPCLPNSCKCSSCDPESAAARTRATKAAKRRNVAAEHTAAPLKPRELRDGEVLRASWDSGPAVFDPGVASRKRARSASIEAQPRVASRAHS